MTLLDTVRPSGRDGDVTVMVTGVGTPGASGIIRALRQTDAFDARIVGVDADPDAYGFSLADTADTVPPGDSDDFVSEVMEIVHSEGVDVILPLVAAELRALSRAKPIFENEHTEVMVSDPDALSVATDTGQLYDELVKQGQPVTPEFYRVSTRDEFVDAVHALGYPNTRVCFTRPDVGEMRGYRVLDQEVDRFSALMNQEPNGGVSSLMDVLPVLEEAVEFPRLVVTEYLPGKEFSVDALARADDVPVLVSRSHTETDGGQAFTSTVEENPELLRSARQLCTSLDLEYNATFQFKYAADGTPKLLAVTPSLSESITASVGAGANMPALGVLYALDRDLPEVDVEWGVHMTRNWTEVFYGPDKEPTSI